MKKIAVLTIFSFVAVMSFGQTNDNNTGNRQSIDRVSGNLLYLYQYEDIKGSPFLFDDWTQAIVIADNTMFKNVQLKFDVMNNEFLYKRNDSSLKLGQNVDEVHFYTRNGDSSVFKKGYSISGAVNGSKYVQVLAEGKITFVKFWKKSIEEYTEYGDATKYKRFNEMYQFYVGKDGKFEPAKVNKKDLQSLLADKWDKVNEYMTKDGWSARDEKGYAAAINYYNSL